MGLLPSKRTEAAPPFLHTGVDFADPFMVHYGNPRKPTRTKVYAALFVCFSTRAIHIELCTDLASETFTAALTRFCSRRGTPAVLYSDNGSNFIGARREIEEVRSMLSSRATQQKVSYIATTKNMDWKLIPPRAPHFGGLWEAGVKAMKVLLRKMMSTRPLSYGELDTILADVQAILNSRPILPVTDTDPDDEIVLTPGHFMIGRPYLAPPPVNIDHVSKISDELWKKWHSRYVQALAARSKWIRPRRNFRVGDIVLLKDSMFSHSHYPLARIQETFPGDDGHVRVVKLLCQGTSYKRSTDRLILLVEGSPPSLPPQDVQAS